MDKFSLQKVLRLKKENENKEFDIIEYHYNRVVYRIKEHYNNYKDSCYYDVDLFIAKLPMYDANDVATKLVKYMLKKGFKCKVIYQNKIYVWWYPKERDKGYLKIIIKEIEKKIELYAKNGNDFCLYNVPLFVSGYPWYDANEVTTLMCKKFQKKGFIVEKDKTVILISWKKEKIEKNHQMKINFQTEEEKRMKVLKNINLINEQRYVDFLNPKKSKTNRLRDDDFLLSNLKKDVSKYK